MNLATTAVRTSVSATSLTRPRRSWSSGDDQAAAVQQERGPSTLQAAEGQLRRDGGPEQAGDGTGGQVAEALHRRRRGRPPRWSSSPASRRPPVAAASSRGSPAAPRWWPGARTRLRGSSLTPGGAGWSEGHGWAFRPPHSGTAGRGREIPFPGKPGLSDVCVACSAPAFRIDQRTRRWRTR